MADMPDMPEESDDDHGGTPPRTPPQQLLARPVLYRPHGWDDSDVSSTTHLSPPASPPSISPYSLGMSPLSPSRRQFSPPTLAPSSPLYPQSDSDHPGPDHGHHEDVAQDSRDVLVQRMNDLVARLGQERHVKDGNIHALHAKVDELEKVLYTRDHSSKKTRYDDRDGSNHSWKPPHPANLLPSDMSRPDSPRRPSPSAKGRAAHRANKKAKSRASNLTVAQAEQVIAEAQDLHKNLEVVISNLRDRQEETEHIHALLITRLERAAQRIIYLEEQLGSLERERKEGDTELLNLQIQLKAIEVQCMSYVPQGADQELSESIGAWKMEYSALKQRRAKNKELLSNNSTPTRRRAAG
ncbi:hypothetical protein F5Y12DRAFT_629797 [Xylaria sp. FL1777]|nr:hypothetical protein F5Y12DRAFT_629797 [Xylaria sp. FL1777]